MLVNVNRPRDVFRVAMPIHQLGATNSCPRAGPLDG